MGFFKAYDMRGTFGVDFDLTTIYKAGAALPSVLRTCNNETDNPRPPRILIGRDCRTTSRAVRDALAAGLRTAGAEVTDLGLCTTPMVYFFTAEEHFDGSVMITASHNPPTDNGLKISRRGALPVGYESGLAEIEARVAADSSVYEPIPDDTAPETTDVKRLARYVSWLRQHADVVASAANLRFAVDCSNGMASLLAHDIFPNAVFINDTLDGTFPNHAPNPLLSAAREQLAEVVRAKHLDFGIVFDGDADRCMFVDETGAFVQPDYLIPILAQTFPETVFRKGVKVIHDVRTSRAAIEAIREAGCEPVIGKVGHAYAKVLLRKVNAVCGGEFAGHYYFRDFYGCDSGAYAAMRLLTPFARAHWKGMKASDLLKPISEKYANSGEVNFKVNDKQAAIERMLDAAASFGVETGRCEIDGVRLEFAEGWISVRRSNTEPYLRLLAECDTPARLEEWMGKLTAAAVK